MEIIVNTFIKVIVDKLRNGYKVKIEGIGTFSTYFKNVYVKKAIKTNEPSVVHNVKCVSFRPSKKLK